jgi:hypothetical protein
LLGDYLIGFLPKLFFLSFSDPLIKIIIHIKRVLFVLELLV